jgi:hypothetical protein
MYTCGYTMYIYRNGYMWYIHGYTTHILTEYAWYIHGPSESYGDYPIPEPRCKCCVKCKMKDAHLKLTQGML